MRFQIAHHAAPAMKENQDGERRLIPGSIDSKGYFRIGTRDGTILHPQNTLRLAPSSKSLKKSCTDLLDGEGLNRR
jgi:hypothetical protein